MDARVTHRALAKDFDWVLFGAVATVLLAGILTLYSASRQSWSETTATYYSRQAVWMLVGFCFMTAAVVIDYHRFVAFAPLIYGAALLGLIVVLVLPSQEQTTKRWLGFGWFQVQPSELCKVATVLMLVWYVDAIKAKIRRPHFFLGVVVLVMVPLVLVLVQPDLGTAFLFVPVMFAMLYLAGSRTKYIISLGLMGIAASPVLWHFLKDYQKRRLVAFIKPDVDPLGWGYQTIQSTITVGSGKFLGKGWLHGTQARLNFLPAQHTDFAFSVFSEEWGFLGASILLGLFLLIIARSVQIALHARDFAGNMLAGGLAAALACHILVNIAVVVGLMPVTGFPLPFVSYGGSSLVSMMTLIGLLLNVRARSRIF